MSSSQSTQIYEPTGPLGCVIRVTFGIRLLWRSRLLENRLPSVCTEGVQLVCRRLYLHLRRRQHHNLLACRNFPADCVSHRVQLVPSQINNASKPLRAARVSATKVWSVSSATNRHMLQSRHVDFVAYQWFCLQYCLRLLAESRQCARRER